MEFSLTSDTQSIPIHNVSDSFALRFIVHSALYLSIFFFFSWNSFTLSIGFVPNDLCSQSHSIVSWPFIYLLFLLFLSFFFFFHFVHDKCFGTLTNIVFHLFACEQWQDINGAGIRCFDPIAFFLSHSLSRSNSTDCIILFGCGTMRAQTGTTADDSEVNWSERYGDSATCTLFGAPAKYVTLQSRISSGHFCNVENHKLLVIFPGNSVSGWRE